MTYLNQEVEVLKSDERGRVRVSVERREGLLDEFERSGMSGAKFARLAGIKYATFANWAARRRKARGEQSQNAAGVVGATGAVRLVEAIVGDGVMARRNGEGLKIDLPGGARVEVDTPMQLQMTAELLVMLSQRGNRQC